MSDYDLRTSKCRLFSRIGGVHSISRERDISTEPRHDQDGSMAQAAEGYWLNQRPDGLVH